MRTIRWILACATGVVMLGACASDGDSAADTTIAETEADAETTAGDDTAGSGAVESSAAPDDSSLDTDTTAVDDTIGVPATDSTVASDDTSDDTTDETPVDVPISFPPIDDVPVCQAFGRLITTSFLTGASGLVPEGEATVAVERIEVVAYAGLGGDATVLRSDVPAELVPSLEPFLARIDAADDALAAGGFSTDEIVAIGDAWNAGLAKIAAGETPDLEADPTELLDPTKLDAAEASFVAAVGTFEDYSSADQSSDVDAQGEAWLEATCPLLSESSNG